MCVFITAVPIVKLFAGGEGDIGGHVLLRAQWVGVYYCSTLLLFITAVPNTKLCAWGEEDSGEHVL
jgi:hypothetical protein